MTNLSCESLASIFDKRSLKESENRKNQKIQENWKIQKIGKINKKLEKFRKINQLKATTKNHNFFLLCHR